jgi:hypothetical protein
MPAVNPTTVYSGPGKLFFNALGFHPDAVNGPINATINEKTTVRGTAMFGEVGETLDDQTATITTIPFDNWGLIGTLFPPYLGVTAPAGSGTVPGGTGALAIGTRPHDYWGGGSNDLAAVEIFTEDLRSYTFVRGAITKHPGLKLGVGVPLYEQIEVTCIGDATKVPGASAYLMAATPVVGQADTSGNASDPGGNFATSDFVNGLWYMANTASTWGALAGWAGAVAEDYWQLVPEVKYDVLTIQKRTVHYKLASARFMIKGKLSGPTHTQQLSTILAHTQGQFMAHGSATNLILNGPSSKTITLVNCEIKGTGFEFGGAKLGTGEIGFVTQTTFTAGAPQPQVIFSA